MGFLTQAAAKLLKGTPLGTVYPPAPVVPLPDSDERNFALERFRAYLAALRFSRTGDVGGPPKVFSVPLENILLEQPDEPKDLRLPAISFLPAKGLIDPTSLGPPEPIEGTEDVFGPGTVLLCYKAEYVESFVVEVWSSHRAERRALMAGLKVAMRPLEETGSLRLTLPAYYDQVATFTLLDSMNVDDPDVIRGRRRGQLTVELRVPQVSLVNYATMKALVEVEMEP